MKPLDPRLLRYSRSSRGFLFAGALSAILSAILVIAQAATISSLVTSIFQHKRNLASNHKLIVLILAIFLLRGLLNFAIEYLASRSSSKMRDELRSELLDKVLGGQAQEIFDEGPATISLLATKGIDNLDSYFSRFLPQLFIAALVPLIVGIAIASKDLTSGIIILATVPLIPLFGIFIGRFTGSATQKRWQTLATLSGYFLDLLTGLPTLKVFGRSKHQEANLEKVGLQYRDETMKVLKISFLSALALEVIATLSVALIAVSIGLRLVGGSLTLKSGLFILILAPEVYWPIRQVASYFHAAADGVEAASRIFAILDSSSEQGEIAIDDVEEISWSELVVKYPHRTNVIIPAGKLTKNRINLIVGPSGSGKSTLFAILLGFQRSYVGEVLISSGGQTFNLRRLEITAWRKQLSWLSQSVNFPKASVREILLQGVRELNDDQLKKVLEHVELDSEALPFGLDTDLGRISEQLSVGQKRKIALARALLKPAQILLLDEPSASVDDIGELGISQAIQDEIANGKIVVLVTHRIGLMGEDPVVVIGAK